LNRLITTFDEVPPYLSTAIHIEADTTLRRVTSTQRSWCNLCKRVPPKSFVQPQPLEKPALPKPGSCKIQSLVRPNSSRDRDSQGLRRPRFSFFILTCQTAQGSQPHFHQKEGLSRSHSTTNHNRWLSAVYPLILVWSFTGAETSQTQGPRRRRAQWSVYKPTPGSLSTPDVNKSSHPAEESFGTGSPDFQQRRAVQEPQSCDDLTVKYAMNRRMPLWLSGGEYLRDRRPSINSSPFPHNRDAPGDLRTIDVRDGRPQFGL
jgi:hypothetical protein